jgi:hypothetical protein
MGRLHLFTFDSSKRVSSNSLNAMTKIMAVTLSKLQKRRGRGEEEGGVKEERKEGGYQ